MKQTLIVEGKTVITSTCDDCQQDKDYCCDCHKGNLYKSPDQPDWREER